MAKEEKTERERRSFDRRRRRDEALSLGTSLGVLATPLSEPTRLAEFTPLAQSTSTFC